jgi:hypothetical protein
MRASPLGARPDLRRSKAPSTDLTCTSPLFFITALQNGKWVLVQMGSVLGAWG